MTWIVSVGGGSQKECCVLQSQSVVNNILTVVGLVERVGCHAGSVVPRGCVANHHQLMCYVGSVALRGRVDNTGRCGHFGSSNWHQFTRPTPTT